MTSRFLFLFLFVTFGFMWALSPARAATGSAEDLRGALENSLSLQTKISTAAGQGLVVTGPVTTAQRDGYVEAMLEGASVLFGNGFTVDIGQVIINAKSQENDRWILKVALPNRLLLLDGFKTPVGDIHIENHEVTLLWVPALDLFQKGKILYEGMTFSLRDDKDFLVRIGAMSGTFNFRENADQTWTGPATFGFKDINVTGTKDGITQTVTLGSFTSDIVYQHVPVLSNRSIKTKILSLIESDATLTAHHLRQTMATIYDESFQMPEELSNIVTFSDVAYSTRTETTEGNGLKVSLSELQMKLSGRDLTNILGRAGMQLRMRGLALVDAPPEVANVIPTHIQKNVELQNLPMDDLGRLFKSLVSFALLSGAPGQEQATSFQDLQNDLVNLPQILTEAGTQLIIKDTFLESKDFQVSLKTNLTADATADTLVRGTVDLILTGFDETLIAAKEATKDRPDKGRFDYYRLRLLPLQLIGQLGKAENGLSTRSYHFEFKPTVGILLNGAALDDVMMSIRPQGGQENAAPP